MMVVMTMWLPRQACSHAGTAAQAAPNRAAAAIATGIISQVIVIAGLLLGWRLGIASLNGLIATGIVLGFAGAAFAVALPLAGRWYPPRHQGKAMGIG